MMKRKKWAIRVLWLAVFAGHAPTFATHTLVVLLLVLVVALIVRCDDMAQHQLLRARATRAQERVGWCISVDDNHGA
jgi:hypothetical protein